MLGRYAIPNVADLLEERGLVVLAFDVPVDGKFDLPRGSTAFR